MKNHFTTIDIETDPASVAILLSLKSGESVVFRPLKTQDAQILGCYFLDLSNQTKQFFGPHPLDQETAIHLCSTINHSNVLRMIATHTKGTQEEVIAYVILHFGVIRHEQERYAQVNLTLNSQTDCTIAPSVADAFQNQGLGTLLMRHLIQVAHKLGYKRMVLLGGTQARNDRAVHFYQKVGFRLVNTFEYPTGCNNYDMILDLIIK